MWSRKGIDGIDITSSSQTGSKRTISHTPPYLSERKGITLYNLMTNSNNFDGSEGKTLSGQLLVTRVVFESLFPESSNSQFFVSTLLGGVLIMPQWVSTRRKVYET